MGAKKWKRPIPGRQKKHFNVYWKTCANFISSADSLCAPEAKFVSIIQAFYSLDENLLLELGEQKSIIECGLSRMVRSGRKESVKPNEKKNGSNRRGLRSRRRMSINYISFTCATYTHTARSIYCILLLFAVPFDLFTKGADRRSSCS